MISGLFFHLSLALHRQTNRALAAELVNLNPTADTFVNSNNPSSNYGTQTTMLSDGSPNKDSYLKFDLTSLAGKTVVSAKLRLRVADDGTSTPQTIRQVTNTTWSETGITYNNRPPLSSTVLATLSTGNVTNTWVETDLSGFVTANTGKVIALGIDTAGSEGLNFNTRESSNKPVLVVQTETAAPTSTPTPAPTATPAPTSSPTVAPTSVPTTPPSPPKTVSTFNSIGIVWPAAGGSASNKASVRFRPTGTIIWREGYPLWWAGSEYRGSIVELTPNTTYEIELTLASGLKEVVTAKTWSENFPVAKTVTLPASSTAQLNITQSGTANGYVLYKPAGTSAVIDVANATSYCVSVKASYIILQGITCRGARVHGIWVEGTSNVVVESSDISGWGTEAGGGFGTNRQSGIYVRSSKRAVLQGNKIHHPRYDTNAWTEIGPNCAATATECHPNGPQGVSFNNDAGGNHVIRYNSFYTDDSHFFNDIIAATGDFTTSLFMNDTDIYGNYLERGWDNPIQAEAASKNGRIWSNFIDLSYSPIGIVPAYAGPTYIWRNFSNVSMKGPAPDTEGGRLFKIGQNIGAIFLFHNTSLQPASPAGTQWRGVMKPLGQVGEVKNLVTRNNIWHGTSYSVDVGSAANGTNDIDYDLYNTRLVPSNIEPNGIQATPVYEAGKYSLQPGTPGHDRGLRIPNFNDDFAGTGPDIGAQEQGASLLQWGAEAFTQ